MTLDLAKIKSDAEKVAANSDLLLMALPVKDVLGMLAEIERISEELSACTTNPGGCSYWMEAARLREKERDQLKAENEALRNGVKGDYDLDAWLAFAEEEPQLRRDAERYRWLRQYTVETLPVAGAMHSLDRQIDEAIAKEKS